VNVMVRVVVYGSNIAIRFAPPNCRSLRRERDGTEIGVHDYHKSMFEFTYRVKAECQLLGIQLSASSVDPPDAVINGIDRLLSHQ
jgi:hypothetical protein